MAIPETLRLPASEIKNFPEAAPRRRPFAEVSIDQVTIPIWRTRWRDTKRRRTYVSYTLAWRDISGRHREKRSTIEAAKRRAEQVATDISNGDIALLQFTHADRASLQRAREILATLPPPRPSIELAVSVYVSLVQKLAGRGTPDQAGDFFLEHCPAGVAPKTIPVLVTEFLAARRNVGGRGRPVSDRWARSLGKQLQAFAAHFDCPLHLVTAGDIEAWLTSLKAKVAGKLVSISPHTRQNYRGAILALVRYAWSKRQLPSTWRELDHVAALKPEDAEIKILTPEQITRLLAVAPPSLVPFIAIAAFAGVRHEEMTGKKKNLLDWRDIDLTAGTIYIRKNVAKTGRDRLVPIQPNLATWLLRYQKPNGRVCALANSSNALTRAKHRARVPTSRGETRNSLRKSFISYRLALVKNIAQVAEEAGTSAGKIRSNYKRCATESEAKRWFNIWPTSADIAQLNFTGI